MPVPNGLQRKETPYTMTSLPATGDYVPVAQDDPRPFIPPGDYFGVCVQVKSRYSRLFKRWICQLDLDTFADSDQPEPDILARLSLYLNLGAGEKPRPTPGGKYWKAWSIANGSQPRRRQPMPVQIFEKHQYRIRVETVNKGEVTEYSRVAELLERTA